MQNYLACPKKMADLLETRGLLYETPLILYIRRGLYWQRGNNYGSYTKHTLSYIKLCFLYIFMKVLYAFINFAILCFVCFFFLPALAVVG